MFDGRIVKELRISLGLTQQQLGDLIGVNKASICGYEKNTKKPKYDKLIKLSEALNTTPNYLMGMEQTVTINEDTEEYNVSISKKDIEIIKAIKKSYELYEKFCENPKRIVDKLTRILK